MAMIEINGKSFPSPDRGLTFEIDSFVDSARNANNEFVGQKVGRDQYKIDNLQWYLLPATVWSELLQEFAKFEIMVKFPDMVTNSMITLTMYPGNRTAQPLYTDPSTQLPTWYTMCKCNIIDCGRS